MNDKVIEVVVAADGSIEIEAKGFSGAECEHATRWLEEALGQKTKDTKTTEYYKGPQQQVKAR